MNIVTYSDEVDALAVLRNAIILGIKEGFFFTLGILVQIDVIVQLPERITNRCPGRTMIVHQEAFDVLEDEAFWLHLIHNSRKLMEKCTSSIGETSSFPVGRERLTRTSAHN